MMNHYQRPRREKSSTFFQFMTNELIEDLVKKIKQEYTAPLGCKIENNCLFIGHKEIIPTIDAMCFYTTKASGLTKRLRLSNQEIYKIENTEIVHVVVNMIIEKIKLCCDLLIKNNGEDVYFLGENQIINILAKSLIQTIFASEVEGYHDYFQKICDNHFVQTKNGTNALLELKSTKKAT